MRQRSTVLPALLLPALLSQPGCLAEDAPASQSTPIGVATFTATRQPGYEIEETFAGRVVSRRRSDLGFERGGRVVAVLVDDGDSVVAGQELARLETRELLARRRQLAARVAEVEARLALARLTTKRRASLLARESTSQQAVDQARSEQDALVASLDGARAALESVSVSLELSRITAPFAGILVERRVDEGTVVGPGQPLLRLIESDAMEFRVGLSPASADRLDPDTRYEVRVDGRSHAARLGQRLPSVDPDSRTVTAVFHFEEVGAALRDGALGRLSLRSQRDQPGFWLPLAALRESRRGLWSAYVLPAEANRQGTLVLREVQILHAEAERAFVRGTLEDGDRVVRGGLHRVVPGQRVRALTPERLAGAARS